MAIHRVGKHWVVHHKDGGLQGKFKTKAAAVKQLAAVKLWYKSHPRKNKLKRARAKRRK